MLTLTCIHVALIVFVSIQQSTEWCVSPSLRRRKLYPQQSLTTVVLGRIHALMMASNVSAEQSVTVARQMFLIPAWHQQKLTLSRTTWCNYIFTCWSSYHLFQLCHTPPCQPPLRKAVKNISQNEVQNCLAAEPRPVSQFVDQYRIPHDIGGSKNDALLGTRAWTVTDSQPKR